MFWRNFVPPRHGTLIQIAVLEELIEQGIEPRLLQHTILVKEGVCLRARVYIETLDEGAGNMPIARERIDRLPEAGLTIIATGPLTALALAESIGAATGAGRGIGAAVARALGLLERALAERSWLLGAHFSVADLNVAAVLSPSRASRLDLGSTPRIRAWLARCYARPAAIRARKPAAPVAPRSDVA